MGSENAHIAFLQPFLRRNGSDCFAGEHSFRYGKSVSNQVYNMIITVLPRNLIMCVEDRGMVVTFKTEFYYMVD